MKRKTLQEKLIGFATLLKSEEPNNSKYYKKHNEVNSLFTQSVVFAIIGESSKNFFSYFWNFYEKVEDEKI